ncbi:hypothetical protein ACFE04_017200 [Oxalis oulophora]
MSKYYIALIILLTILFPYVNSVSFKIPRFDADVANIIYKGDAQADPENGFVEMNIVEYKSRVGHVVYADKVRIWDSKTGKLTNISTHFTFLVDTQGKSLYAAGLTFYLVPVGFQIPINSACGFLGLFNTTTIKLAQDQIVFVEFDTNNNPNWDPPDVAGHVGINNNSVSSTVYTPWNVSLHDRDNADVWINYDAATMNLSVKWSYQKTNNLAEHSSLSLKIDLRKVLPEWATVGFSAATSDLVERHVLSFWEFSSSLESEEKSPNSGRRIKVIISSVVLSAAVIFVAVSIILRRWMDRKGQVYEDTVNLTSMNFSELEKLTGPRKFSEIEESSYYGLVGWVWDLYGREQLHSCVDEKLNGVFDKKQVERLLIVGLWCAHPDFRQRASIRQAIHVLNFEVELPDLPTAIPVPTFQMSTSSSYTCLPSNASITNSSILVGR